MEKNKRRTYSIDVRIQCGSEFQKDVMLGILKEIGYLWGEGHKGNDLIILAKDSGIS